MHVHTDMQYIPSIWTPGNCLPASVTVTVLNIVPVYMRRSRNDTQEAHASTLAETAASSGELVQGSLWIFIHANGLFAASNWKSDEGRVSVTSRFVGEVIVNVTASTLQSQILLWNVKFDEEFITSSDCRVSLHSPTVEVVKVCDWGMQCVCVSNVLCAPDNKLPFAVAHRSARWSAWVALSHLLIP